MRKLIQTTFSIVAVLLLSIAFVQCKDAKDAAMTKFMELQAAQVNKECPMDMGNGLVMDGCTVDGSKTFKYTFTVSEEVASQLTISDELKPAMVQAIKGLAEFKQIEQFGITFAYVYNDTNKKELGKVTITPEDYK